MSLQRIVCLSSAAVTDPLAELISGSIDRVPFTDRNYVLISITSSRRPATAIGDYERRWVGVGLPGVAAALQRSGCVDAMSFGFADYTDSYYQKNREHKDVKEMCIRCNGEAARIVQYLAGLKNIRHDLAWDLVIHCGAGVSRSGAVATYAAKLFGVSSEFLARCNPHITPSIQVLSELEACDVPG